MDAFSKGNLFDPILVADLVSKVKGSSALAALSQQTPIPFNGMKEFTFTLDQDVDVVAENGKKSHGGLTVEPVIIRPIKVEYGARVSDEFLAAAQEDKINILKAFNDGFAKKVARGLDLMAFHGLNPRTKEASAVIGDNNFDKAVTQTVQIDAGMADPETAVESVVGVVRGTNNVVTGMAMAPVFATALAKLKVNGVRQYPELAWGANPDSLKGLGLSVNSTVSEGNGIKDRLVLGDFANRFKWGYAKTIPLEIIQYGDPDNSNKDLKGYNQVYLRAEAYIGWGILDPAAFAIVKEA